MCFGIICHLHSRRVFESASFSLDEWALSLLILCLLELGFWGCYFFATLLRPMKKAGWDFPHHWVGSGLVNPFLSTRDVSRRSLLKKKKLYALLSTTAPSTLKKENSKDASTYKEDQQQYQRKQSLLWFEGIPATVPEISKSTSQSSTRWRNTWGAFMSIKKSRIAYIDKVNIDQCQSRSDDLTSHRSSIRIFS